MRGTHTLQFDRRDSGPIVGSSQPALVLKVVRGPDKRRQRRCEELRFTVGAVASDFTLSDPTVSAIHCAFEWTEIGLLVRDLGSKNGVMLEGRRVREAIVRHGDLIELGTTALKVQFEDDLIKTPLSSRSSFGELVGSSIAMRTLYESLERVSAKDVTVLLTGESGVGKELAASAIIENSARKNGPVVVFDCAAVAPNLIESELFGHEKGAYTGADRSVDGVFERADGGTLVFDSICEMPHALQPRLLGAIERRVVQRVGGTKPCSFDVRIIATSQVELEQLVNQNKFRADLFYRLSGVQIRLPPLREHVEDIPELIARFLEELGGKSLAPVVLEQLCAANYPGNVRQLRSAVERAVLGLTVPTAAMSSAATSVDLSRPLLHQRDELAADFERRYLMAQLDACEGNISEAARRSGVDRMHLHRLLAKHQIASPKAARRQGQRS